MSRLKLRLQIGLEENLPEFGVVANVYDVSSRVSERKSVRDLVIPAGPFPERFEEVKLDPGQYVIEAILPSGEVISEEVSIDESTEQRELLLKSDVSPHEWLAWQHFAGNVERSRDAYYKRQQSIVEQKDAVNIRADLVSLLTLPPRILELDMSSPGALVSRGLFFALPQLKDIDPTQPLPDSLPFFGVLVPPVIRDPTSWVYFFEQDSTSFPSYEVECFKRHYLFVRSQGIPAQYCVLPVPWMQADFHGEAAAQVLVRSIAVNPEVSPATDPGYRISVTVHDHVVGSIISYLGTGKLQAAATIMKKAIEMLEEKVANPMAAAAGAYVLLGTEDLSQPKDWHDWVGNLMKWFPWLPDGAIQHAWLKMNQQDSERNLFEARASLLEGYRRGLPFYSKGVGMLRDGLALFANDARAAGEPDKEIEAALKLVRQLALRTNMRQPFATVLL